MQSQYSRKSPNPKIQSATNAANNRKPRKKKKKHAKTMPRTSKTLKIGGKLEFMCEGDVKGPAGGAKDRAENGVARKRRRGLKIPKVKAIQIEPPAASGGSSTV